jgi:3-oxoacyl-[acyl-carrier-protein] synthase III
MIGIQAIAGYVPSERVSNYATKEQFGIDDDFIENKIGVRSKARKGSGEETSDLCVAAFEALAAETGVSAGDVDCLLVCTQNPDGRGLPHTSAVVHGKLGCKDEVAAFDVSLGCSGFVYSLCVQTALMEAHNLQHGLLFTADPYSKIVDPNDKNTSLLFGDAATVTLLTRQSLWTLERAAFATRGSEGDGLVNQDGRLSMNGRAIFNFSMTSVPPQINALAAASGRQLSDFDLVLLHQGSKYIVDVMTRRLQLDPARAPSNLAELGNTVSSSIPLLLRGYVRDEQINTILVSGFGVGLSWASAILVRNAERKSI